MLPSLKYPAGCIFITVDPQSIDVNIHPRKEEIHFTHPRTIEDLIESTVRKGLEQLHAEQLGKAPVPYVHTSSTPSSELPAFQGSFKPAHSSESTLDTHKDENLFLARIAPHFAPEAAPKQALSTAQAPQPEQREPSLTSVSPVQFSTPVHTSTIVQTSTPEELSVPLQPTAPMAIPHATVTTSNMNFRLLGQLALTYILIETDKGLVLIDQHAAHERILYERFKATFDNPGRIRLLIPQIIVLTKEDAALFEPHLPLLSSFGIDAQFISDHELSIQETSIYTKNLSLEECIKQALSAIQEHSSLEEKELKAIIHERFHASMSCKAAVKGGDTLSHESMHRLITDLSTTEKYSPVPMVDLLSGSSPSLR